MHRLMSILTLLSATTLTRAADPLPLKVLFLGDQAHHQPAARFRQLQPVFAARNIDLVYTEAVAALNRDNLNRYDGLLLFANIDAIVPEHEKALLDFVASGKGFIPVHCASYCFRNSEKFVELVGAQFQRHDTGTFRTERGSDHPIMNGFGGFESWDETYIHSKHNERERTVLETRYESGKKEPWTWVRTHGKGRVFYTAWGHDHRTWGHPGFHNLMERGVRWACGQDPGVVPAFVDKPTMTAPSTDVAPFEYVDANVPFYPPGETWGKTMPGMRKMQKPLPPEESLKHYVHPDNFKLELFAAEPNFGGKPIAMNWDERGRLWVAVTVDYPNEMQRQGEGHDKLLICEDTDGDWKADKFTVFADKVSIPTSFTFSRGGVIVAQAPHTLFLKDTNGDDRADVREILFTGWGIGDTHAGPSNLRYGLDNWIYGMCGYSGFNGTVGGERVRFGQGMFRFKPDGSKLEFLRSTSNNSWGLGISEEGFIFGSTANGNPSVFLDIPNRYYERVRGWSAPVLSMISDDDRYHPITDKIRQVDFHGRFTSAAGHAIYTARAYPPVYWNKTAFVCDPTGHLVACFQITPDGAGFRSRYAWNLLASDDEWAAPIAAEVGPDGCVWVLDWYSYIVQHNPTPPGHKTGKGAAYETDLRDKKHGRVYRLVPKDGFKPKPISLAGATPEKLVETLQNDNMFWRMHAQRLIVEGNPDNSKAIINRGLRPISVVQAQRESLLQSVDAGPSRDAPAAMEELVTLMARHRDPILLNAATCVAAVNDVAFMRQVKEARIPQSVIERVAEHHARGKPKDLGAVIDALSTASPTNARAMLAGLSRGWPRDHRVALDAATGGKLAQLLTKLPADSRGTLISLTQKWGSNILAEHAGALVETFLAQVRDAKLPDAERVAAAGQLAVLRPADAGSAKAILELLTAQSSPELSRGLLAAIGQWTANDVGAVLAERLPSLTPASKPAAIAALVGRTSWVPALLDALDKNSIRLSDLALDQQQALLNHANADIAKRAKAIIARGGGLPDADRDKVLQAFLNLCEKRGNTKAGALVFKNHCAKCHKHGDEGTTIGPDLTGMAVHTKEHLLTDIIDPSRSVEGNYKIYRVTTGAGQTIHGLLASETKTAVEIVDVEAKRHTLARSDIEDLQASTKSLMPDGFEKTLKESELVDLLAFLTARGKYLPLPLEKVATVVSTKGMFYSTEADAERLIFADWGPKTVQGVPFRLVDPQGDRVPNVVMLRSANGTIPPKMPMSVKLPCNAALRTVHVLGGIGGWAYPYDSRRTVSMIVRLQLADGSTEDHELKNGEHIADYIRKVDVPGSQFAFALRGQQVRYLALPVKSSAIVKEIELLKGPDRVAPVVMAVTVEVRE